VIRLPSSSTALGPTTRAVPRSSFAPAFSIRPSYTRSSRAISTFLFAMSVGHENDDSPTVQP
jgi:hypothetical protein